MSQLPTSNTSVGERCGHATPGPHDPARLRMQLHGKELADARLRAALARSLRLTATELLAIQHLARAGQLTPGQLCQLLQLSSSGTTAVIRRLHDAGHITRHAQADDARSVVVRLTPTVSASVADSLASYVTGLDALIAALPDAERDMIVRFLRCAADAADRHADELARDIRDSAHHALPSPLRSRCPDPTRRRETSATWCGPS